MSLTLEAAEIIERNTDRQDVLESLNGFVVSAG